MPWFLLLMPTQGTGRLFKRFPPMVYTSAVFLTLPKKARWHDCGPLYLLLRLTPGTEGPIRVREDRLGPYERRLLGLPDARSWNPCPQYL